MKKYISIRNLISCVIPAFFFAAFMVLGKSFYKDNSWDLVFGSSELLKTSILQGIGYFLLFSVGIAILFHLWTGSVSGSMADITGRSRFAFT